MNTSQIDPIGVEGLNPDFAKLADACYCKSAYANSEGLFIKSFEDALSYCGPTIIVVKENDDWLD